MSCFYTNSTTKVAPHLDGVHVVFGLVISGFEVVKKIEGLKTDSASRPYADVRVVDCGQLITKSANDVMGGKRKRTSYSADSSTDSPGSSSQLSSMESENESEEKHRHHRHKRQAKNKRSKRKRKETISKKNNDNASAQCSVDVDLPAREMEDEEKSVKREKPVVRADEIPPVPENRFLLRRDMPALQDQTDTTEQEVAALTNDLKPCVTKSGRKIKGRGTMRYHTPTRSKSRSLSVEERGSSETPPHWKEEMKRTMTYQPPSVERWSKGDKLNDGSVWSYSPWSRSPDASSGHSSDRSSQQCILKKKKKAKHKKKAKKTQTC